ncbi:MAG TPA: hypothetical protein VGT04_15410 [Acidobacteriaceae bacterium]|nr:hypothetical protein [Acidobacteriaceae bacterium]
MRKRRRSRAEAEQLVREYESSGLRRQAFCAERGLSLAVLDKYRRQYRRATQSGEGRLVPVEVMAGVSAVARGGSALWLELSNGWRIEVGSGFDVETLRRLLNVLEPA